MNKIVLIDKSKCIGCEKCIKLCPKQILYLDKDKKCCVSDEKKCDKFAGCQFICPEKAIKIIQ